MSLLLSFLSYLFLAAAIAQFLVNLLVDDWLVAAAAIVCGCMFLVLRWSAWLFRDGD